MYVGRTYIVLHDGNTLVGGRVGISRGCKAHLSVGSIEDAVVTLPGQKRYTPHKLSSTNEKKG